MDRPRSRATPRFSSMVRRRALVAVAAALGTAIAAAGPSALAEVDGRALAGGTIPFRVALTNPGPRTVALGPTNALYGWVLLSPGGDKVLYSGRLPLTPLTVWPTSLVAGATVAFAPVDVGPVDLFPYAPGMRIVGGYPAPPDGAAVPAASGTAARLLQPGRVGCTWLLAVPQPGVAAPVVARTPRLDLTLAFDAGPAATPTNSAVAALLERFDRDAWSARAAHAEAVKEGPALLPDLIAAAGVRQRPSHSRMWLVTAIADVPDPRAATALRDLLADPADEVRCVAAYHGPKQRDAALDAAIAQAAAAPRSARFAAYALLGFLVHRGEAPVELVSASLQSDDPRVRSTATAAFKSMASGSDKARLAALLKDSPDERIRTVARGVLDAMQPPAGR